MKVYDDKFKLAFTLGTYYTVLREHAHHITDRMKNSKYNL